MGWLCHLKPICGEWERKEWVRETANEKPGNWVVINQKPVQMIRAKVNLLQSCTCQLMWEAPVPNDVHLSACDTWHDIHDIMTRHVVVDWVTWWHSSFPVWVTNNLSLWSLSCVLPCYICAGSEGPSVQFLCFVTWYAQCLKRRYESGKEMKANIKCKSNEFKDQSIDFSVFRHFRGWM